MLANDFVEYYQRVENNIVTNSETFFPDREGKLIFTTPFFTENKLQSTDKIASSNILPSNSSFIVDAITFLTTNPNIQNYLPFKIFFLDRRIEFNDVTLSDITDYRIIVDPPINLNTIENKRYGTPVNYVLDVDSAVVVTDVGQSGNSIGEEGLMWFVVDGSLQYLSADGLVSGNLVLTNPVDFIFTSPRQTIAITEDNDIVSVYNPIAPAVLYNFGVFANWLQVSLLNRDLVIMSSGNNGSVNVYTKNDTENNDYRENYIVTDIFSFTPEFMNAYDTNTYIGGDTLGRIGYSRISCNNTVEKVIDLQLRNEFVGNQISIFFGGSSINRPNISIFLERDTDDAFDWYFIPYSYLENFSPQSPLLTPRTFNLNTVGVMLKRTRNTVYFTKDCDIYFCNLDTNGAFKYSYDSLTSRILPRRRQITYFSRYSQLYVGDTYTLSNPDSPSVLTRFPNSRPFNKIYKVTFNYSERAYPLEYSGQDLNIGLTLPNGTPVSDCEIFKYIIDFRIRYSKTKMAVNPTQPIDSSKTIQPDGLQMCQADCKLEPEVETECTKVCKDKSDKQCLDSCKEKNCFTKCNRTTGSVDRILGYVGSDFSVADFLNIYSTR